MDSIFNFLKQAFEMKYIIASFFIVALIIFSYFFSRQKLEPVLEVFTKYRNLLKELVSRDIKTKYKRSVLGIVWSILNPLLMMLVLTFVFSILFHQAIPNFPVYLLTGQIIFSFFSDSTNLAMNSIITNSSLIKKIYIPKYIFPLSRVLSSFVNLLFSLIALLFVMIVTKASFSWAMLLFPIPLIYILVFSLGVGLILSAYVVFFRDILFLYGVILTAWTYLTPIFYPISIIPVKYLLIYKLNPLYHYITYFREIMLYGRVPSFELNISCIFYAVITLLIGLYVFYKRQNDFILYI
jgi:ABC-2 type transport system permease protein